MYSPLAHTIPKPSSEKLHMVVDHSTGKYSLNSMIDPKDIAGVKLNSIKSLGASLRSFRAKTPTLNYSYLNPTWAPHINRCPYIFYISS